jgi:hypothetical protein
MSALLYGIGAFALVAGAILVGFGIPINEFSFGNTLILAGTTSVVGGLIVVGLAAVVAQLQRLAGAQATTRVPGRASRPIEMFEPAAESPPAQAPLPTKPKPNSVPREAASSDLSRQSWPPAEPLPEQASVSSFAPTLRNPYEPPASVDGEVSISPHQPMPAPAPAAADAEKDRQEPHTAYFDAMWPAETKPTESPIDSEAEAEPHTGRQYNDPRSVAILKSGVVDGMGYTLYVDGSIEAELPQGTLRFASINELRSHLENNA